MKVNSKNIKKGLISGGIQGFVFALAMAAFDYLGNEPFDLNKFLFYFFFFGLIMGLTTVFSNSKKNKKC
ncbi:MULTISPECIES: hypothetical protein [Bizionia]|uniref:Uncharacterized protein n=1 Tax=Bizionia algoritergicola TaxID=291187 RepID=A0A5D0QX01_9FLAO|nr:MULTISPECIES: hypothetical protein [Bizionia]OBX21452.1 hypothetical protein BAA08_12495 [Bizionia sp. APA-3]TYB73702.1 hypothetical protein ES675_08610 [Bizionia algoritergicola]